MDEVAAFYRIPKWVVIIMNKKPRLQFNQLITFRLCSKNVTRNTLWRVNLQIPEIFA